MSAFLASSSRWSVRASRSKTKKATVEKVKEKLPLGTKHLETKVNCCVAPERLLLAVTERFRMNSLFHFVLLGATLLCREVKARDHAQLQVEWLKENGGFFSPKMKFRLIDENDKDSPWGVFAVDDIKQGNCHCRASSMPAYFRRIQTNVRYSAESHEAKGTW